METVKEMSLTVKKSHASETMRPGSLGQSTYIEMMIYVSSTGHLGLLKSLLRRPSVSVAFIAQTLANFRLRWFDGKKP